MAKWDAGTIRSNGVEIPVKVDDQSGEWQADHAGKYLRYETRDKLKAALDRMTKAAKATVEVSVIKVSQYSGWGEGNVSVYRGVLTGFHAGTGNVLATWTVRGKPMKEQITRDSRVSYVAGDTSDQELNEYNRLLKLKKKTIDEIRSWEKTHQVDPKEAVQRAIDARMGKE